MRGISSLATLALCIGMAGCGDGNAKPEGSPQSRIYNQYYGAVYKRPAVTTEDRALSYWAQDIAQDYAGPRVKDAPASLAAATLSLDCSLPAPSAEALVVFVEIYGGYDDAPLYFVTDRDIERVRQTIETTRKRPRLDRMLEKQAAKQVDVFVTETEQPVYLVLAAYNETIWSLQIAAGARLDGVSVIGHESQALAHAPEGARVGFAVVDNSPQLSCVELPQRPVTDSWEALEKLDDKRVGRGFRKTVDEAREQHYRFRDWLRARVGDPDRTLDAYRTAHVLIGPRPATPLRYRRLTGTQLAFTPNSTPVWGDRGDAADAIYRLADPGR